MSGPESSSKPPGQPGYSAFISYATEADRETAFKIVEHLEAHGLKCWIAPRNVRAGKQYAGEIVRGIGAARSFILVLSQTSNNSKFVRREVEQADRKDKPIYAVRIEQVDPSDDLQLFLSEIHWIDAWKGDLAAHIKALGELLREEEPAGASPEPKPEAPTPKLKQPAVSPAEPASKARKQALLLKREPKERAEPERLTTRLAGRSWLFAIRGALALAVGGALISDGQYPVTAESLAVTASLLAAYLIADGSLALVTGIGLRSSPWRFAFIAEGLACDDRRRVPAYGRIRADASRALYDGDRRGSRGRCAEDRCARRPPVAAHKCRVLARLRLRFRGRVHGRRPYGLGIDLSDHLGVALVRRGRHVSLRCLSPRRPPPRATDG